MGWYEEFRAMADETAPEGRNLRESAYRGVPQLSGSVKTEDYLGTTGNWANDLIASTRNQAQEYDGAKEQSIAARKALEEARRMQEDLKRRQEALAKQNASGGIDPNDMRRMAIAQSSGWTGTEPLAAHEWQALQRRGQVPLGNTGLTTNAGVQNYMKLKYGGGGLNNPSPVPYFDYDPDPTDAYGMLSPAGAIQQAQAGMGLSLGGGGTKPANQPQSIQSVFQQMMAKLNG